MFNLNEDNCIVMAQHPTDMRMGVNGICGQVSHEHEVAPLGTWRLCDVLQTFGARPFPSSHISSSGHRLQIYALG